MAPSSVSSLFTLQWLVPSLAHHVQPACARCIRGRRAIHHTSSTSSASSPTSSSSSSSTQQTATKSGNDKASSIAATQTFNTANGRVKIDLSNRSLIGVHQSRGERPYQEDTFAIKALQLQCDEIGRTLQKDGKPAGSSLAGTPPHNSGKQAPSSSSSVNASSDTAPSDAKGEEQTLYCAVFDGHNGSQVSTFLASHLHERLLSVEQSEANSIVSSYRALGGYMRRYKGGLLAGLVEPPAPRRTNKIARELKVEEERRARVDRGEEEDSSYNKPSENVQESENNKKVKNDKPPWTLLHRIEAAFLKTDLEIIKTEQEAGSTSTVALLHSLDEPRNPFFSSKELHLILAHCGDTRALLCTVPDGTAIRLTETHHPEARSETDRLMRIRTGAVTDSFGESRWAGSLANTRAFGDAHYKALGVFSEPQLVSQKIKGADHAFLILLSDGITEVLSDQEICDLSSRDFMNPTQAAKNVISFAESVGAQDNLTCLIVPLAGWGKVEGGDSTKARRELRLTNYEGRSNRQNRM